MVMAYWDKRKLKLVHLGEKVAQLDNCKEDRFTQIMTHLQQELAEKEALENLQETVQENKKENPPSTVTFEASTMA
jgi:hypothetical protein